MNSVLFAWASCGDEDAGKRAQAYLDEMESSYFSGLLELQPDTRSYGLVLSAWSKSSCTDKYRRALQILRRMERQQKKNPNVVVDEHARSLVINTCGFSNSGDDASQTEAFEVAVTIFNEIVESHQPSSLSFGWFIQACGRLRVPEEKKHGQIERAFRLCCDAGLVNDFVLHRLMGAASDPLYRKLIQPARNLGSSMNRKQTLQLLPNEWKRNSSKWQKSTG